MAKTKSKGDTAKKKAKSRKAAPDKASAGTALAVAAPAAKGRTKKAARSRGKSAEMTVAGFKIPKALRKLGPIRDMLTSDLGREILADALVAAAGAAALALTKTRGSSDVKTVAKAAAQGVMTSAAGTVAGVVSEAARHFLPPGLLHEGDAPTSEGPAAAKGRPAPSTKSAAKPAAKRAAGRSASGRSAAKRPSSAAATPGPAAAPEPDRAGTDSEGSSQA